MRIPIQTFTFCVVLTATSACADRVTSPASAVGTSEVLAAASGATKESGDALLTGDDVRYVDCVGEVVRFHVDFPYHWTQTVTPTGNIIFRDRFVAGGGGHAEGLSSGSVWTVEHYVSPEVIIANAGQKAFFVAIVRWASTTAPTFTIHNTLHFVQNANGDVKVDRYESRCVTPGNK